MKKKGFLQRAISIILIQLNIHDLHDSSWYTLGYLGL